MKLDDLIAALQERRATMGNCEVAIDDADTTWHLQVQTIEPPTRRPDRLLIKGDYDKKCEDY